MVRADNHFSKEFYPIFTPLCCIVLHWLICFALWPILITLLLLYLRWEWWQSTDQSTGRENMLTHQMERGRRLCWQLWWVSEWVSERFISFHPLIFRTDSISIFLFHLSFFLSPPFFFLFPHSFIRNSILCTFLIFLDDLLHSQLFDLLPIFSFVFSSISFLLFFSSLPSIASSSHSFIHPLQLSLFVMIYCLFYLFIYFDPIVNVLLYLKSQKSFITYNILFQVCTSS